MKNSKCLVLQFLSFVFLFCEYTIDSIFTHRRRKDLDCCFIHWGSENEWIVIITCGIRTPRSRATARLQEVRASLLFAKWRGFHICIIVTVKWTEPRQLEHKTEVLCLNDGKLQDGDEVTGVYEFSTHFFYSFGICDGCRMCTFFIFGQQSMWKFIDDIKLKGVGTWLKQIQWHWV